VTPEAIKELEGTEESTLLLLRASSEPRMRQKRLVRELQQQLAALKLEPGCSGVEERFTDQRGGRSRNS
jgi:hypothetical protein